MNKTIIFLLVAIIIILLAVFFINLNKTEAPTENGVVTEENISESEGESLSNIEDGTYTVNTEKSKVEWTGRKKILTNWIDKGTIDIQSGSLTISEGSVDSNKLVIDMSSISPNQTGSGSGESQLEQHLKSDDFFAVETYPTANFVAKSIDVNSENSFTVVGDMTIKGITNEISVPVQAVITDGMYKISGQTDLDRTMWDIKFGSDKFFQGLGDNVIDDNITIDFEIYATAN